MMYSEYLMKTATQAQIFHNPINESVTVNSVWHVPREYAVKTDQLIYVYMNMHIPKLHAHLCIP